MSQAADPLFLAFQQALIGRYSIDRELGRGGMGIVYLAREVHLDRLVAIKLLPPERGRDPLVKERFLREARLAAKLSHPNIIPIHAVEETGGFVYYVMAFVDGETLANRVRTRGPLHPSEAARVLREVAWALAYAHGQGLIHRDVKPDNILMEAATNRVLVADFGIAAAVGEAHDGVSGTPEFMSPEQALAKPLDARSDLYALGATAFFVFSGRFPFEGKSATEVLARQVTEPAPPLSSLGLTVPRKLASLVDRCLAKDPSERPADAQQLAEQLGVALERRREVPALLRAFVKRTGRLNGGGTLLGLAGLMPVSSFATMYLGPKVGILSFALGLTAVPFAYLTLRAREMLRAGFSHADVGPAYQVEIEQSREERSHTPGALARFVETTAVALTKVSAGLLVLSVLLMLAWQGGGLDQRDWMQRFFIDLAQIAMFTTPVTTIVFGTAYHALANRYRDPDTELWAGLWRGDIGRAAFALAKRLLGKVKRGAAITHRATELSLGLAAEELFEGLPRDTRRALADLPPALRRLQHDAQELRKRREELSDALASVREATASSEYAELFALRTQIEARLSDAVGALESIRLNLLRLHAGSATVESVTTHLGIAAEVSEEVERLIAGQDEVARYLSFPRTPASTPA